MILTELPLPESASYPLKFISGGTRNWQYEPSKKVPEKYMQLKPPRAQSTCGIEWNEVHIIIKTHRKVSFHTGRLYCIILRGIKKSAYRHLLWGVADLAHYCRVIVFGECYCWANAHLSEIVKRFYWAYNFGFPIFDCACHAFYIIFGPLVKSYGKINYSLSSYLDW